MTFIMNSSNDVYVNGIFCCFIVYLFKIDAYKANMNYHYIFFKLSKSIILLINFNK